jgi:acyl-CoA thioester hydrolase
VYHAQYLSFMERARTELLNSLGIDLAVLAERRNVQFMVHELSVKYHRGARLNELLSVSAEVVKIGRASLVFRQRVERPGEMLVEAEVGVAIVERNRMRPARMPPELEEALK